MCMTLISIAILHTDKNKMANHSKRHKQYFHSIENNVIKHIQQYLHKKKLKKGLNLNNSCTAFTIQPSLHPSQFFLYNIQSILHRHLLYIKWILTSTFHMIKTLVSPILLHLVYPHRYYPYTVFNFTKNHHEYDHLDTLVVFVVGTDKPYSPVDNPIKAPILCYRNT